MEIILFVFGIILVIVGLPFCLSCQIHTFLEKNSKRNTTPATRQEYQHGKRDRNIGVTLMIIGAILIVLSFASSVM